MDSQEFSLKPLSPEGVVPALERARHYRLLNEPAQAESICRDVLLLDPHNRDAKVTLILALTDQFGLNTGGPLREAADIASALPDAYDREYYTGIVHERQGNAVLDSGHLGCGPIVYDRLRRAMDAYERAEAIRPGGNDDAVLRWNTCARLIMKHDQVRPPETPPREMMLE